MIRQSTLLAAIGVIGMTGCARDRMQIEVSAAVLYEKPRLREVSHSINDTRADGGAFLVRVVVTGDPGLAGTFDILPGITEGQPLAETDDGTYVGQFAFPETTVGGPFTIIGRLKHDVAGEVNVRDPKTIVIPLVGAPR